MSNLFRSLYDASRTALTTGGAENLDEAYHIKDTAARREISDRQNFHAGMINKHYDHMRLGGKDEHKHELAILSHQYAIRHYGTMSDGLPQDYHQNGEFYGKLNDMVTKHAKGKSKDCGVNSD